MRMVSFSAFDGQKAYPNIFEVFGCRGEEGKVVNDLGEYPQLRRVSAHKIGEPFRRRVRYLLDTFYPGSNQRLADFGADVGKHVTR